MNKDDVISFMQTYQRITENMFKKMTNYASILVNLGSDHQINSIKYKQYEKNFYFITCFNTPML